MNIIKILPRVSKLAEEGYTQMRRLTKNGEQVWRKGAETGDTTYVYVKNGKISHAAQRTLKKAPSAYESSYARVDINNSGYGHSLKLCADYNLVNITNVNKGILSDCLKSQNFKVDKKMKLIEQNITTFEKSHVTGKETYKYYLRGYADGIRHKKDFISGYTRINDVNRGGVPSYRVPVNSKRGLPTFTSPTEVAENKELSPLGDFSKWIV